MRRIMCPKCENYISFDETKYSEGQSLVFVCEHCSKQFGIRIGKTKTKAMRKEENVLEEVQKLKKRFGYINVLENVFGYQQIIPLKEGRNVIGRKCVGTNISSPIETADMSIDRIHCAVDVKVLKSGRIVYSVEDLESVTGTFVMNELLKHKEKMTVYDGSIITIGAATMILNTNDSVEKE